MEALLARLRRQADDILMVAPADGLGKMWASHANIRLLCWDQAAGGISQSPAIGLILCAGGVPLTGTGGSGVARGMPWRPWTLARKPC